MSTKLCAEWIDYMDAYRIYNPDNPNQTIAYEDNIITSIRYCGRDTVGLANRFYVNERYFVHINPPVIAQCDYVYDEYDTRFRNKDVENNILLQVRAYLKKIESEE